MNKDADLMAAIKFEAEVEKYFALQGRLGREPSCAECLRNGVRLYQGGLCAAHGHRFRSARAFSCWDCNHEYQGVYNALRTLVRKGLIRQEGGGRYPVQQSDGGGAQRICSRRAVAPVTAQVDRRRQAIGGAFGQDRHSQGCKGRRCRTSISQ